MIILIYVIVISSNMIKEKYKYSELTELIRQELPQNQRLVELNKVAITQIRSLVENKNFVNAHLLKEGLAEVDSEFKYKNKFLGR
jgi:hypothetical protein